MELLAAVFLYFTVLLIISRKFSHKATNISFYRGEQRSPWYMVAFGMVGASISGITFVSIPGMVVTSGMTYLQLCLGFILGYITIAFVLLPLYYRLNLTTIYSYLGQRLGRKSYQTGAWFFLLSKLAGASVKFYVVCVILQRFVFQGYGFPFWLTVTLLITLIWLYTHLGGIRTLVFTDVFQTICLFLALFLIIYNVVEQLGLTLHEALSAVLADKHSIVLDTGDWTSPHNLWKQLLSGMFIVIVMTGLDQDMMQKNLTCRNLRDAQKDMCIYGIAFLPVNFLFLALGILLCQLSVNQGVPIPLATDELLPMYVKHSSPYICMLFTIGIVAASFSSADSALTSLTTCYCVDIRQQQDNEPLRHKAHFVICCLFIMSILLFDSINSTSLIDAIYIMVSYTYGPLLGLFSFGLFTNRKVIDYYVPYIAIASPLLCYAIETATSTILNYHFGYELLMFNGLLTFFGLLVFSRKEYQ